jgi:cysteine-S-conjugate beta-lyase
MTFDFDAVIDRRGTNAMKWETPAGKWNAPEAIPMWVADMDFASPPAVVEALARRVEHGVFGYSSTPLSVWEAVAFWMKERHGWDVDVDWLSRAPGVVPSLYACVRAYADPGDGVLVQTPVYHPFFSAVELTGRRLVRNSLRFASGVWGMDFDDLVRRIDDRTRMIILCSPHNPVGRVWTEAELRKLAEIVLARDLIIVSDEIHGDLVFRGHRHIPLASLGPEIAARTVTLGAPSKTFNIAGLATSFAVIPDKTLRERFRRELAAAGFELPNVLGLTAMEAAYRGGGPWLEALLEYLEAGADLAVRFFEDRLAPLRLSKPEGTYLALIDGRGLGLSPKDLDEFFLRKAGVCLSGGAMFGKEAEGFTRMNFACPHAVLRRALGRIERALSGSTGRISERS